MLVLELDTDPNNVDDEEPLDWVDELDEVLLEIWASCGLRMLENEFMAQWLPVCEGCNPVQCRIADSRLISSVEALGKSVNRSSPQP